MGKVLDDPQRVNMPCLMHDIHLNQLAVKNKITAKSISLSDMRKIVWLVYKLTRISYQLGWSARFGNLIHSGKWQHKDKQIVLYF